MRILLLSQFYPPDIGGIEVHVRALARGLTARGHDVAVATLTPASPNDLETGDEFTVHRLRGTAQRFGALYSTDRRHAPPVPDPEVVSALRRLVDGFAPEVVHAHNWLGRSFVPIKRSSHAAYIVTLHDCGIACSQGRMMYRSEQLCSGPGPTKCLGCCSHFYGPLKGLVTVLGNRLMRGPESRAVDMFVPVSQAIADANQLTGSGLPYTVIPNFSVDKPGEQPPSDTRLDALPDVPFILQVGDVAADKGVEVALDAYARLESPPPFVLVGRNILGLDETLPPGVTVTGAWPHELVAEAWRRSMFAILPSLCLDACPTASLEAMAASRPVIASALGGLTDQVVAGVTGLLVEPGDVDALHGAMARLAANPELRSAMGSAGRARYEEHFRAEVVIDQIEQLYRSLVPR